MREMLFGAVLAVVGIFLGFAFATGVDPTAQAKWWDMAAIFGTWAAVAIALFLAISQSGKERSAAVLRARMQAGLLEKRLPMIHGALKVIAKKAENYSSTNFQSALPTFVKAMDDCDYVSMEDVVALAGAPHDCALVVAELIGYCHALRKILAMKPTQQAIAMSYAQTARDLADRAIALCGARASWK